MSQLQNLGSGKNTRRPCLLGGQYNNIYIMYATNLQNNLVLLYREVFTDKITDEYFESQHF